MGRWWRYKWITFHPSLTGVWESEDQEKATVDQTGLVRGVAQGTANISFTSNSGSKKATKSVTINPAD